MPAPAAISPRASAAAPMRDKVGSIQVGMLKPIRLAPKPQAVDTIKGLRMISPSRPRSVCRAMDQTEIALNSGTKMPISSAISKLPCGPARRSINAMATKELKRNPTCALAACKRSGI